MQQTIRSEKKAKNGNFRPFFDTLEDRNAPGSLLGTTDWGIGLGQAMPAITQSRAQKVTTSTKVQHERVPPSIYTTSGMLTQVAQQVVRTALARQAGNTAEAVAPITASIASQFNSFLNNVEKQLGNSDNTLHALVQQVVGRTQVGPGSGFIGNEESSTADQGQLDAYAGMVDNIKPRAKNGFVFKRGVAPTLTIKYLHEWNVQLQAGTNAQQVAANTGGTVSGQSLIANRFFIKYPTTMTVAQVEASLRNQPGVAQFERIKDGSTFAQPNFTPNDPLYPIQWHLNNTGQGGGKKNIDVNVINAWNTFKGEGVSVRIVDTGVDFLNPDLQPNFNPFSSHDYSDDASGGDIVDPEDGHGTSVAGIIAARGDNGFGVSGIAPEATITSTRIFGDGVSNLEAFQSHALFAQETDVSNNSWGFPLPFVGQFFTQMELQELDAAMLYGVTQGRHGLGTVYVHSAGNQGDIGVSSNSKIMTNSIYTMSVAGVGNLGVRVPYSSTGSNVFITAPTGGVGFFPVTGTRDITTTDISERTPDDVWGYALGDTNNTFNGTSAAAPMVAGVVAMILDANPNLGWRDVQEIVARTARKIDPANSSWKVNAAGFNISNQYGFGLIDTLAATTLAQNWTNVGEQVVSGGFKFVNQRIRDNNTTGLTSTINIPDNFKIEKVVARVKGQHPTNGDLRVTLTSPSGTISNLHDPYVDLFSGASEVPFAGSHEFMSVQFLGEVSGGNWTLNVSDRRGGFEGRLDDWTLEIYGRSLSDPGGGGGGGGGGGDGGDGTRDLLFEPNETADRARMLTTLDQEDLAIAARASNRPADRDWFKFVASASGIITARIDISGSSATSDLDLRVHTPLKTSPLYLKELGVGQGTTRGATEFEEVAFNVVAGKTYYINVLGFNRSTGNYNLTFSDIEAV